jgi:AcrR family transcriptional regulator
MVQVAARDTLLERVLDDVARHGLVDASLRALAMRVGTSHRMLLYHFGSREGLIAAMSAAVEAGQAEAFRHLAHQKLAPSELAMAMWRQVSAAEVLPFVRIFFEVVPYAIGRQPGTEAFRDGFLDRWLTVDDLPAGAGAQIRLGVAVVRGLLLDVLVTGDRDTADAAMAAFATLLDQA